jgi:hypothetical protein
LTIRCLAVRRRMYGGSTARDAAIVYFTRVSRNMKATRP